MCECYTIGGPFIAEDPDCEVHGAGGLESQLQECFDRIAELEQEVATLRRQALENAG